MSYDPEDPAGFSIKSRNPETQSRLNSYWNRRSRGYSLNTLLQLHDIAEYEHLIENHVPQGRRAFILDVGTSCGLMAIIAARMGHIVTAVDILPSMIAHAKSNAKKYGLQIDFIEADAHELDFPEGSFDLIIARSTIWNMVRPVKAMSKWCQLLRPGGHLLIIDGNYYLGHFEKDYAEKMHLNSLKNSENTSMHGKTNMDKINFNELHEIALDLPACAMRRPAWDVSVLMGLSMDNIFVNNDDEKPYKILTSSGHMVIPGNFIVSARRPPADIAGKSFDQVELTKEIDNDSESIERGVKVLKALADTNRMRIVKILENSPSNVKDLSEQLSISVALTSHNLKILSEANIVKSNKVGKEVMYYISERHSIEEIIYQAKIKF